MLTAIRTAGMAGPTDEKDSGSEELRVLQEVCDWLEDGIGQASQSRDTAALLRHARDRALVLMLFWRRVGAAELVDVQVENMDVSPLSGVTCNFMSQGRRRQVNWRPIAVPTLRHLCPVAAVRLWLSVAKIRCGPLFPQIKHGGDLAHEGLPAHSVFPLLLSFVALSHEGDAPSARRNRRC